MPPFFRPLVVAAAAALVGACAQRTPAAGDIATGVVIQDVTIVDTRAGALARHQSVVLDGARIVRVADAQAVHPGSAVRVIDGRGKYLVPGFLDMHTHALPAADASPPPWPLLIANGITGIREMAGSPELIARARKLNADSAAGRVDAPEVLAVPGPPIVGAATPEQGRALVDEHKAMGADFIKLIAASPPASLAVLAEAKSQGLAVAGHLSPGLSALDSSNGGWRSIEHLGSGLGLLIDCSTDEAAVRADVVHNAARPAFSAQYIASPMLFRGADERFYRRVLDTYSEDKCAALARVFARNDTWQVPTLIRLQGIAESDDAGLMGNPDLAYVDKATRAQWATLGQRYGTELPASAREAFRDYYGLQRQVVKLMARNDVKMMTGSDLGGIWVVPGFSLHQEFHALADSGLTPLEVLQATTLNGARYLDREASMGSVEAGRNADLVLLDDNPLADVAHLDAIATVVLKGKVFDAQALAALKAGVAQAYARQPLRDAPAARPPDHLD